MKLAATDSLTSALAILGMADPGDEFSLHTIQDWYRSGAETYSLRFSVSNLLRRSEFMLKACVAYSDRQPLKEIFANWLSRRHLIDGLGVSTPRLHATGNAVLVEEYIPYSLVDALASGAHREAILRSIGRTTGLLVHGRFKIARGLGPVGSPFPHRPLLGSRTQQQSRPG
ncbi:MAG: hypothetical protein ACRDUV_23215, partial [Pseudonocardiaceae bacterium]